jgi:hypothetical protein
MWIVRSATRTQLMFNLKQIGGSGGLKRLMNLYQLMNRRMSISNADWKNIVSRV